MIFYWTYDNEATARWHIISNSAALSGKSTNFFFKPSLSLTPSLNYFRARFTNNKSETHYRSASRTSSNYLIIYSWFSINLQFISHTGMILTNVHDLSLYYLSVLKCSVHDCILHCCSVCDCTECGCIVCIILDRTHYPQIFKTWLNMSVKI